MRIEIGFGVKFDRFNNPITDDIDEFLKTAIEKASLMFGGCNVVRGTGGWHPNGLPVVIEPSATLTIVSDFRPESEEGKRTLSRALSLATWIKDVLNQDSVIVSVVSSALVYV